jgi:Na+/H+ antiporter NhaD/arsenite permease-like protein
MIALIVAVFALGYLAIILEHPLKLNKSATALLTGVLCWTVYALGGDPDAIHGAFEGHIAELSGILFFLLGAMTIVELIDAHDGFQLITSRITTRNRRKLLVILALLTFVLSAILDNLTTSIIMMSLIRKLMSGDEDRMYYGGIVIIAANAGGAWSPVGDVSTTMLWIGGQVTTAHLVAKLIIPSTVSVIVPIAWLWLRRRGTITPPPSLDPGADQAPCTPRGQKIILFTGIGALAFVPVFKMVTHLPPFAGVLLGLGILWVVTEVLHKTASPELRDPLTVAGALQRIDSPSILFFLGILLAISALQSVGVLPALAAALDRWIGNADVVTVSVGLASAVIDNVPLVAATQGMYSLATYPTDHPFWIFLAYCAGTGGSILIIGSAAGVAVMGLQRISFGWYLRKLSLPALLGYLAGAASYLGLRSLGM